ncbi:hypothetical protein KFL_000570130 [Klebsormidium nitens]|uniref:Transthyretin/hydroxyisourate hydrolase domain-containing protein n=1 Tax=Klebsormidium nitens TaxID=105231 RepID=A0A0U9HRU6_KLENI|nr:hypothetical protein KFL_000570130 [Klebsormidium nitens]|eukprot:GAQ80565.1 hypothetical protein KFL_000570130 [Klebsormidium nitens]
MEPIGLYPSIAWFNSLGIGEAIDALRKCCHSAQFAQLVAQARPFENYVDLVQHARNVWLNQVGIPAWLEAFGGHPRIGDVSGLREKFGASAEFSEGEQGAALASANESVLQELALWNKNYEDKFGHVFLICASGKTSGEVLEAVKARFSNCPHDEIRIAAVEQQKITELRLEKLLNSNSDEATQSSTRTSLESTPMAALSHSVDELATRAPWPQPQRGASETVGSGLNMRGGAHGRLAQIENHLTAGRGPGGALAEDQRAKHGEPTAASGFPDHEPHRLSMQPTAAGAAGLRSPITTHVLDLSHGRPAKGVAVDLEGLTGDTWQSLGKGATDADGRVIGLLPASDHVAAGMYKLRFQTGAYLQNMTKADRGDPGRVGADGGFYPQVDIVFEVKPSQTREHFHVPLILSPYSYTTYRGS